MNVAHVGAESMWMLLEDHTCVWVLYPISVLSGCSFCLPGPPTVPNGDSACLWQELLAGSQGSSVGGFPAALGPYGREDGKCLSMDAGERGGKKEAPSWWPGWASIGSAASGSGSRARNRLRVRERNRE